MRPYVAVWSARVRLLLQYRAAAAAGFATQFFWGWIRLMVLEAFYRSSTAPQPMDLDDTITYIWLGQAMLALLPWNVDTDLRALIRTGGVAYELLRPTDLYAFWYARVLALRLAPTLLRCLPMFAVAIAACGMQPPDSVASGLAWVACTAGSLALSAALTLLITLSLLWTIAGEGISRLVPSLVMLGSGLLVPVPLMPDWMRALCEASPFAGVADLPFRVYTGQIPVERAWIVLAHQAAWTGALVWAGRAVLARGTRRLAVQGG